MYAKMYLLTYLLTYLQFTKFVHKVLAYFLKFSHLFWPNLLVWRWCAIHNADCYRAIFFMVWPHMIISKILARWLCLSGGASAAGTIWKFFWSILHHVVDVNEFCTFQCHYQLWSRPSNILFNDNEFEGKVQKGQQSKSQRQRQH